MLVLIIFIELFNTLSPCTHNSLATFNIDFAEIFSRMTNNLPQLIAIATIRLNNYMTLCMREFEKYTYYRGYDQEYTLN